MVAAAGAIALGIALQFTARSKLSAAVFHLLLIAVLGLAFIACREATDIPMLKLMQGMSGSSSGGR